METQALNESFFSVILLLASGTILISTSVIFFFIKYQRKVLAQREEIQRTELTYKEQLVQSNIRSQEEERLRISKDLHDHVGSTLSHLRLLVAHVDKAVPPGHEIGRLTQEYRNTIDVLINDVRNLSHNLSPHGLSLWGLHEVLEDLCEKTNRTPGIHATVIDHTDGILSGLSFDHGLAIYRVMQELLNNSLKHSGADTITLTVMKHNDAVKISYQDNGKGFSFDKKTIRGIGMRNIESRLEMTGATHTITTSPGQGFQCDVWIPLQSFNQKTE